PEGQRLLPAAAQARGPGEKQAPGGDETAQSTVRQLKKMVPAENCDDSQNEEVFPEDDCTAAEGEGDLQACVEAFHGRAEAHAAPGADVPPITHHHPEAVDDFLRNFLSQMSMAETLDCFQTEWAEKVQKRLVDAERVDVVPDVYSENQRLYSKLINTQREEEEYRRAAAAGAGTLERAQKARDFYKLQHKRVVQEKNRLLEEMRRLKAQCDSCEHEMRRMDEKYQASVKQMMLVAAQRDKRAGQLDPHTSASVRHPRPPPPVNTTKSQSRVAERRKCGGGALTFQSSQLNRTCLEPFYLCAFSPIYAATFNLALKCHRFTDFFSLLTSLICVGSKCQLLLFYYQLSLPFCSKMKLIHPAFPS
uniref:Sperm associated antigen 16 n=1 Tax=Mola mola TaxID=94237 RepID=A0A3Q3W7W8_MOLML